MKRSSFIFSTVAVLLIALVIACVVLESINLSKLSNEKSNPAPAAKIVSYYFNIHTYSVSYDDVQKNYAAAAQKLRDELSKVLSPTSTQQRYRKSVTTNPTLSILGISENQQGGVIVMSGISYLDKHDPGAINVRKDIESLANTTLLNIIDNQSPSAATSDSQLCTVVNGKSSSVVPTKLTTLTTTTSSSKTTTTTPRLEHIKCNIDIGIVFDASTSSGKPNLIKQIEFTSKLSNTWTIDKNSVEVIVFTNGYDDDVKGNYTFNYPDNSAFVRDLEHLSHFPLQGTYCVECALADVSGFVSDKRPSVSLRTLLFVYGSDYEDVSVAIKYYRDDLIQGKDKIIIVAVGPNVDIRLLKSITGSVIATEQLDNNLIQKINEEMCSPRVDALPLPPPPTPIVTTTGTTLPTASPYPGPPPKGAIFVALIMDASDAAGSNNIAKQSAFIIDHLIRNWTVNMSAIEVDVYASALNNYYGGRYIFNYPSKLDLEDDLKQLGKLDPLGASCIDCGILLISKDYLSKTHNIRLASIIFTYASTENDIYFASEDAWMVLANPGDNLIIVGIGSGVDEKRLRTVTENVITAEELDDALASKINDAIWSTQGTPTLELQEGRKIKSFARTNGKRRSHNHLNRAFTWSPSLTT